MKNLLNLLLYLICSIIILHYVNLNNYQKTKILKKQKQINQLDDALKSLGIGGAGEKSQIQITITDVLIKFGYKSNYTWRYKDLVFPLKEETTYITSEFNDIRYDKIRKTFFYEKSTDLKCLDDLRIKSSFTGHCIEVDYNNIYGNYVIIKNDKYEIQYGHLERVDIKKDQEIIQGQVIGLLGNTGHCMVYDYQIKKWRDITKKERIKGIGRHLDYNLKINGIDVNPFANSLYGNIL